MALATYGHVIEELEGGEQRPAEDVIREERRLAERCASPPKYGRIAVARAVACPYGAKGQATREDL